MNPTTTHSAEIVGFLAGYTGTTLEAYRLDLRGWISWLDVAFLDPFAVEAHTSSCTPAGASPKARRARRSGVGWLVS
jgi:hypothetical protein